MAPSPRPPSPASLSATCTCMHTCPGGRCQGVQVSEGTPRQPLESRIRRAHAGGGGGFLYPISAPVQLAENACKAEPQRGAARRGDRGAVPRTHLQVCGSGHTCTGAARQRSASGCRPPSGPAPCGRQPAGRTAGGPHRPDPAPAVWALSARARRAGVSYREVSRPERGEAKRSATGRPCSVLAAIHSPALRLRAWVVYMKKAPRSRNRAGRARSPRVTSP